MTAVYVLDVALSGAAGMRAMVGGQMFDS